MLLTHKCPKCGIDHECNSTPEPDKLCLKCEIGKEKRIRRLTDMCSQLHSKFSQRLAEKMLIDIIDIDNELWILEGEDKP
jgi:hypothetical protein